jgi:ferredoxin--NADP+ reductase
VANFRVAVVGAGPAGLYAAKTLAEAGVEVSIFNRDIKPGGLAEYGIYYDKHKMKEGLRKQFRILLSDPRIAYFGNVTVGNKADLTLGDIRDLGFQAVVVAAGAQGTKLLGIQGETLRRVHHAKDIVYHYNQLPPYATQEPEIGQRVVIIGVGNVMMDIAHWLIRDKKVEWVKAVARRGPAEVKFDKAEMQIIGANLDRAQLDQELERCRPMMEAVWENVADARDGILAGVPKALPPVSSTLFQLEFLESPTMILDDGEGGVGGLEVEDTRLVKVGDEIKAKALGTRHILPCDTVIFAIGDGVDPDFGLPVESNAFVKNPEPRFAVDGLSYEVYDPQAKKPIDGVFLVGWSREASYGLVGVARKDGTAGANAVLAYLDAAADEPTGNGFNEQLAVRLSQLGKSVVTKSDWAKLETVEASEAKARGLEVFKFSTNEEMLAAIRN